MKHADVKFVCDIISTVANAIDTRTIPEAVDYLVEKYNNLDDPVLEHAFNVLDTINNKQKQYET